MKKVACIMLSTLLLASCSNSPKGTAGLPDVNPSPAGPPGVDYTAPSSTAPAAPRQQYTYVFPDSQNACAPAPQRFVAASGAVTFRVKNCTKDEYDYLPEGNQSRIDALIEQCRAMCAASAPATSTN
jgi:hypothetical protein